MGRMMSFRVSAYLLAVTFVTLMLTDPAVCDASSNEVKRNKGIGSCTVLVGFLFHHKIPDDAFTGDVAEYQVSEACDEGLPDWLDFDQSTKTFSGFTQASQVESKTFICVKAIGSGSPPSVAKDVFSVEVDVGLTPDFTCPETDSVVLLTIYMDMTLSLLSKEEILRVLNSAGETFNTPPDNVLFTRFLRRYPASKRPVLFSGKSDSESQKSVGGCIQVHVGCSSDSITEDHPYLQLMRSKAPTGELSRIIGYPVMDWTVHKGFPHPPANVHPLCKRD